MTFIELKVVNDYGSMVRVIVKMATWEATHG
jgi:hypothetical protein